MPSRREWLWLTGFFLAANLIFWMTQPELRFPPDAEKYSAMAAQAAEGLPFRAAAPFVYRPGTPGLAGYLSSGTGLPLSTSFKFINVFANFATVVLLTLWLRPRIGSPTLRLAMLAYFIVEPHSPVRFTHMYPVYVDPVAMLALSAGLLALDRFESRHDWATAALAAVIVGGGVVFRETTLAIGVAMLCGPRQARMVRAWVPLITGCVMLWVVRSHAIETASPYSTMGEIVHWLREKSIVSYVLAWLLLFGPMMVLPILEWRASWSLLKPHRQLQAYLAIFAGLAWVGGSDTERLLVLASPVVLALVAHAFSSSQLAGQPQAVAIIVVMQALAARTFGVIQGPGTASPSTLQQALAYQNLWSQFCTPALTAKYCVAYGVLIATVVWLWLRQGRRRPLTA